MLSIEEYKKLLGDRLKGMTEEEINAWYEVHTIFLARIMKEWKESPDKKRKKI